MRATLLAFLVLSFPLSAQDPDSDLLRGLTAPLPLLPLERIELKAGPAVTFEGISAVASDRQGNLYVLHRPVEGDPVVVVDSQGKVLRSWGRGLFKIPHGIRIDPAGSVWTVDAHTSMVYKFTPDGRKLLEISVGDIPDPTRDFCGATDIAFGPDDRVFVTDGYCNGRVIEYDARGTKVRQWGRRGTGPGEFDVVHGIALGPNGNLYIADRENGRLQWFDLEGRFLGQWKFGGQLYAVAFGPTGEIYIGTHPKGVPFDTESNVVQLDPRTGRMLGRIPVRAHELAVDRQGTLLPATRSGALLLLRPRR